MAGIQDRSRCEEWPTYLDSRLAWHGNQFTSDEAYTLLLSEDDRKEIDAALQSFKDLGLDGQEVNRDNFQLPKLHARLTSCTSELHRGRGFFVVRGLDSQKFSPEDNTIVFLGLSSHIAERRGKQDTDGNMFAHLREASKMKVAQEDRPFKDSNVAQTFHNDMFSDILAMQVRGLAAEGGRHFLASAWTVYNELVAERPDLLEVLASDWIFDNRGRMNTPKKRPLVFFYGGNIIVNFSKNSLVGPPNMPRAEELPALSLAQYEALEEFQSIAEKHQLPLSLQPGDLTFVNNHAILHGREAFRDDEHNTRYIVRLWLKNDALAWKLPYQLQQGNRKMFHDISVPEKWNVAYSPRLSFQVRECFSP